jgi:Mg-chelatase subunit ChlD
MIDNINLSKNNKTVVTLLVDASGSMGSCYNETISGINEYIDTLKASDGNITFSLISFNGITGATVINKNEKINNVEPLTESVYQTTGATPLYESIEKAIDATKEVVGNDDVNVVFVIQTDGVENCSAPGYNKQTSSKKIKDLTSKGWQFIFMGTDIDAYGEAGGLGISTTNTVKYRRDNTRELYRSIGMNTVAYASSANATTMNFSDQQKSQLEDSE